MKAIISFALLFCGLQVFGQTEVIYEANGTKLIKGFMTQQELATDTAFSWFHTNQEHYIPNQATLEAMRSNRDSINIIAFGGTWCGDTKTILPKFFRITDAAGLSPDRVTLLGVDHNKKTIQHLSEAFNVTRVPTFIVMKNGREIGRVVEYGKTGMWDKELGDIISGTNQ